MFYKIIMYFLLPLFVRGRWLLWFVLLFVFLLFSNSIIALRMDIPDPNYVVKVSGQFVDMKERAVANSGRYNLAIVDFYGEEHQCNCDPLYNSNCFRFDYEELVSLIDEFNPDDLNGKTTHKALLEYLGGRYGEVWYYDNGGFLGLRNSCYHVSSGGVIYLKFDDMVSEYLKRKSGIDVFVFFIFVSALAFSFFIYFSFRLIMFFRGVGREK